MPRRFVILTHDHPSLHWDLLIEEGETLRAWRLLREPVDPQSAIEATPLPPHRRLYLDYEGPVSGNRGHVTRWDDGHCDILSDTGNSLQLRLNGQKLTGRFRLSGTGESWKFLAETDYSLE